MVMPLSRCYRVQINEADVKRLRRGFAARLMVRSQRFAA
jgi:hypothetical protein